MPTLIQQSKNSATGVAVNGTMTITLPQATTVGNVVVVCNTANGGSINMSGGGVGSWTYNFSSVHENAAVVVGRVDGTPSTTLTVTNGGSGTVDICSIAAEFQQISTATDGNATNTGTASPIATASITTTKPTAVLISHGSDTGSMTAGTAGAGWTAFTAPTQQPLAKIESAYRIVSATGTYSDTWADTGSTGWDSIIIAFQGATPFDDSESVSAPISSGAVTGAMPVVQAGADEYAPVGVGDEDALWNVAVGQYPTIMFYPRG
jgi:hypothetical protein